MEKNIKKLVKSIFLMVLAGNLLLLIPFRGVRRIYDMVIRTGNFDLRHLRFLWEADRSSMILAAVFVLMALILVSNFLSFLSALFGILRSGNAGQTAAGARETREVSRSYRTAGKRAAAQPQSRPGAQDAKRSRKAGEQQVSYIYKTGKERYMEQLDNFLRDGVVTKAEYEELRRKYEKMDL